ncbi:MAG: energy-coupling factor transporter transmembrane component T family protein [Oscillospiraceae bacterium]|jgi:energy-coupling factor transport system permease protein
MARLPTGMYLPGNSLLHRLDPRVKLLAFLGLFLAVVAAKTPTGYCAALAAAVLAVALSGLPFKTALGGVGAMFPFFLVIFLMNLCFFSSDGAWFSVWIVHPSPAGMTQGAHVVLNVVVVLMLSNVLNCTTSPMALTGALEDLFSPLRFVGVPTARVAMILSVAVQFIPVLYEEAESVRRVQTARSASFESHKLSEKAAAVLPLAVPIFLAAFRRADELSLAMESRGYDGHARRRKKDAVSLRVADYSTLAAVAVLCVLQLVVL